MGVGLQGETVVQGRLLNINIYLKAVLNRPDQNVQALKVKKPVINASPVHHNTSLLFVNREFRSLCVYHEV